MRWIMLLVRLPAEPSRHRVAVWRELRKVGALSLGQGAWAVPDVPAVQEGVDRAIGLATGSAGEVVVLHAAGRSEADDAGLQARYTEARQAEWTEFLGDCDAFEAELDKETRAAKFTLAELEEEEQSMDRLRRWHRDIKVRDIFTAPHQAEADRRLADCAARLETFTELVFQAVHQA